MSRLRCGAPAVLSVTVVAALISCEIHNNQGYVFRAQRIASLYHPGSGVAVKALRESV
jgi:hypothetical protein